MINFERKGRLFLFTVKKSLTFSKKWGIIVKVFVLSGFQSEYRSGHSEGVSCKEQRDGIARLLPSVKPFG